MTWCDKCLTEREGGFCLSCGSKLVAKPEVKLETEATHSASTRNPLEIASFITASLGAILLVISLFVGASLNELKIQHDDAATAYEIHAKGMDDGFKSWTACRETAFD